MPKKIDETEVKKECPSCGLGVSLESKVCEFCGWDFEEEDEWILQIEKLERDLMLEKQKFEPGTVNEKIESTLHSPALVMKESAKPPPETEPVVTAPKRGRATEAKKAVPVPEPIVQKPVQTKPPTTKPSVAEVPPQVSVKPAPAKVAAPEPVATRAQTAAPQEPTPPSVRRMRVVKSAPTGEVREGEAPKRKLVRKVKERS